MSTQRAAKNIIQPAAAIVVLRLQFNFGLDNVDFHCLRVDQDGSGNQFGHDRVTKEELGIPKDMPLLDGLTNAMVIDFISQVEAGVPVRLDAPPLPKVEEPAPIEVAPLPQVTIGGDTPATT
jgi:hypothetical protein